MKSYVPFLLGLYGAILSDLAEQIPDIRVENDRDFSRLRSLVGSRGLSFLMVDLPEAGKRFDEALDQGHLNLSCIPGQRAYKRGTAIPRLFRGMLFRVFDDNGVLKADPDIQAIRGLRQLYFGAKKFSIACDPSKTWEHVNEFFKVDQEVRRGTLSWDFDDLWTCDPGVLHLCNTPSHSPTPLLDESPADESHLHGLDGALETTQRVADAAIATFGKFLPAEWRFKHGPGAVADQRHTQFKYDIPNWPTKLDRIFPYEEFAFVNYSAWADAVRDGIVASSHEPASKLIAVPKTLKGPRLIASEPVAHQWCQQSILDYLVSRVADSPIASAVHFRDQSWNRKAAISASHDGSHWTVDLSSASDRLSCWLVERIFRRQPTLIDAMHASRTRWVVNTIDKKSPKFHRLRKFACMGSACTFPVQTIVFACVAIGAVLYTRGMPVNFATIRSAAREVQVFGDDIVIPADSGDLLLKLLHHLGLKVNSHKTFTGSNFRESCGADAFRGQLVTPVYVRRAPDRARPESIHSSVDFHNNLVSSGLFGAADYVKSTTLRIKGLSLIPNVPMDVGAFGWTDWRGVGNPNLRRRWNPATHQLETRALTSIARVRRVAARGYSMLHQYYTEALGGRFIRPDRLGKASRPTSQLACRWVVIGA